jgi:hypothetical protein
MVSLSTRVNIVSLIKQLNILDELDEEDHIIINYNFSGRHIQQALL